MKHYKLSVLTLALAAAGLSANVMAQTAKKEDKEKTVQEQIEVIGVTGFRGSLQKAQIIKMSETSVVEALSAEDIGKLPDTSVAESLSRLPGLAGETRNGRTSGLSVRGFNENYVGVSLNGRELLGMGDNRGVEYDLYPAEIVQTVLVYKTPDASLMAQGIGGSVDLQTATPLSADRTAAVNFSYEKNAKDSGNPDFSNNGHRLSVNLVDKFMNDKLGVAVVAASMKSPRQEQQFRGWGYAGANAAKAAPGVSVPAGTVVLGGHDSFTRSAMLDRKSLATIIEFAPNDKFSAKFDALYIDFNEKDARRGLEEGGAEWGTGNYTITKVENGLATEGYYDGFASVIRNDAREQDSTLKTYGLNLEYNISDEWTAALDLSTGDVEKTITDIESYSGVGRAGSGVLPMAARSWKMTDTGVVYSNHPTIAPLDYSNAALVKLAGPQAWGGSLAPVARFQGNAQYAPNTAQDGFVNQPEFEESMDTIRIDLKGDVEWGIFKKASVGVISKDREKTKINGGAYLTAKVWPNADPIPNVLGTADLSFIGISGVPAYDSLALYRSGYYIATDAAELENGRKGDTYTISEKLNTVYGKLDLSTELGDVNVEGNLGVQIVSAKQEGVGYYATTGANLYTNAAPVSDEASYTDVLPSANFSFEVAERQYVRTSASKVMSRPRMDDMRPNAVVSFNFNDTNIKSTDPLNSAWGGSSGNTKLRPLEANQFDLSYENYFHDRGYVATSFFFKDLVNWHRGGTAIADFSPSYIPSYHKATDGSAPGTMLGRVNYREDGLTGFVRGYEVQLSLPFEMVHPMLDGFGLFTSATFLDGKLGDNNERVPGLSNETYTMTFFYENSGFEARIAGTKRDDYQTENRGLSLSLVPEVKLGGKYIDAQVSYDFKDAGIKGLEGLRVSLQGQNLTDQSDVSTNGNDARQITLYQNYGRNYMLSFNYKF